MDKNILKPEDILTSPRPFHIESVLISKDFSCDQNTPSIKNSNLQDDTLGKNDELIDEVDLLKTQIARLKNEKQTLSQDIENQKKSALEEADKTVKDLVLKTEEEKENIILSAQKEAEEIIKEANQQADSTTQEAQKSKVQVLEKAQEEGFEKGYEESFQKAEDEIKRLVSLLQTVTSNILDEKTKILTSIETDLVDLTLLIANKVVKSITENYKQVVYDNVAAAVQKLKLKSDLIIKVNPDDLPTMEKYKATLLKDIDDLENIQFIEDPSIEKGGCIVKSDFGSVDARISSQFAEIEEQVRRISPIKDL